MEGVGIVKKRGIGVACLIHANSLRYYYDNEGSAAIVKLVDDGTATVMTGASEMGQGSVTVMAMIAAEELGIPVEDVRVINEVGSDILPEDLGAYASRSTFISGRAVQAAAADAKNQLFETVALVLEVPKERLEAKNRIIYDREDPANSITYREAMMIHLYEPSRHTGRTIFIVGKGSVDVDNTFPDPDTGYGNPPATTIFAAHVAEIEVDDETGEIQVLKHSAAVDLGRVINVTTAEGQIEGSVAQGIGYGMFENMELQDGKVLNPSYLEYKMPTTLDIPDVVTINIESLDPAGPYGAKGLGEPALVPVAASINNALYNAVGVRLYKLPFTRERVLRAIREKQAGKVF